MKELCSESVIHATGFFRGFFDAVKMFLLDLRKHVEMISVPGKVRSMSVSSTESQNWTASDWKGRQTRSRAHVASARDRRRDALAHASTIDTAHTTNKLQTDAPGTRIDLRH